MTELTPVETENPLGGAYFISGYNIQYYISLLSVTCRIWQDGVARDGVAEDGEGFEAAEARPEHLREPAEGACRSRRRDLHRGQHGHSEGPLSSALVNWLNIIMSSNS